MINTTSHRIFLGVIFGLVFVISSCKSKTPTETLIPTPTPIMSIETLRANPNYMAGCEKINPHPENVQAGYQGIYPGRTTQNEVEELIGKPLRINYLGGWEYDNLVVSFDKTVVSELYVDGDSATTLKDFIVQYGCPDEIYAKSTSEGRPSGDYSELLFMYHRIGFDFKIDHIPAELNDIPYRMTYFIPGTLADIQNSLPWLDALNFAKPIPWDEAVK